MRWYAIITDDSILTFIMSFIHNDEISATLECILELEP